MNLNTHILTSSALNIHLNQHICNLNLMRKYSGPTPITRGKVAPPYNSTILGWSRPGQHTHPIRKKKNTLPLPPNC